MKFVSLHTHSTYSYGDGYGLPKHHVARVAELGMSALALTEHGNLSSVVGLAKAAREQGIKPIFGIEAYTGPADMRERKFLRKWHQTLLASTQVGYQNLMRLVTRSWSEGFYQWPTVTYPMLAELNEGLIVTSGCADSKLACDLLGGKGIERGSVTRAEMTLHRYHELFGDRYYLEVQRFPQLERTRALNKQYAQFARKYGIPLVATADVHYPYPEQNEMQKILHAASRNTGTVAAAEAEWEYSIPLTYPTSDDNIAFDLVHTGLTVAESWQAIENTAEIASRCDVELPVMDRLVYPYAAEGASSEMELLRRWLNEGWVYRQMDRRLPPDRHRAYREQAEYELATIAGKGFLSYFLMIADLVRHAKSVGIAVGPGRGSAAASLVAYLLRITEIDSMAFPLMDFSRFIAPDRDDLPDIDIDFETDRRDEVRRYANDKYGEDRVGNVGTLTYYRGRNSIGEVARVHELPYALTQQLKSMVVERPDEIARGVEVNTVELTRSLFKTVADAFVKYPVLELAAKLEGNVERFGVHPAGIVIGAEPLDRYVATYSREVGTGRNKKVARVLSVDKYDGEELGLLKIDALGLKTMSIVGDAARMVGMSMDDVYAIPLEDEQVLAAFRRGDVGGVFQFEGATTRDICVEVQPEVFMDLSHIVSLSRPGPLHGGSTSDFIANRRTGKRDPWPDEAEAVLGLTEGELVYQEQVMALARQVGGFDAIGASQVRNIISKKKGQAAFTPLWERFLAGAAERGISEAYAASLWRKMITAGGYAFNVPHAVSYSVLATWCMWLRVHHTREFFLSLLQHNVGDVDPNTKIPHTEKILKDMLTTTNLQLLPLDLQLSAGSWTLEADGVRPGFAQIHGVGEGTGAKIAEWRDQQALLFRLEWQDLLAAKVGIGPAKFKDVIKFAESEDPFGVQKIARNVRSITQWARKQGYPQPDKLSTDIPYTAGRWDGVLLGVVHEVVFKDLFETHRSRTGEDLDPATVKQPNLSRSAALYCEDIRGRFKINVGRFVFPNHERSIERIRTGIDYILAVTGKGQYPGKTLFCNEIYVIEPDEE